MESYPGDLLVGVLPLVFAVNAIFDPNSSGDEPPAIVDVDLSSPPTKQRTDFERFLDALAASLADENEDQDDSGEQVEFRPTISHDAAARSKSLFNADEDDVEDSEILDLLGDDDDDSKRRHSSIRLYTNFGLSRRSVSNPGNDTHHNTVNTSYAKSMQQGQGFFQRARIVSISPKHGFPPSKDPTGSENFVNQLKQAKGSRQTQREIVASRPIQGILPSGWLEKHVYALPSVLLVVAKLGKTNQDAQDHHLLKTVENMYYSLVPKRECKIQVVCLVDDDVKVSQAEEWSLQICRLILEENSEHFQPNEFPQLTLLRASKDLRSGSDGFLTSVPLRRLHRTVRDASLLYYMGQARRIRSKLAQFYDLTGKRKSAIKRKPNPPKEILPLVVRYCFKIAIFYEFQWKFERSLRFMTEAYRNVRSYYHYINKHILRGNELISAEEDHRSRSERKVSSSVTRLASLESEEVEVSLDNSAGEADDGIWSALAAPPSDMVHQCYSVADWINFKLLHVGFASHTEGGLLAASAQWRQHSRLFCSKRYRGGHPMMQEEWYFWCQVAQQRLVFSQLVERHPSKTLESAAGDYEEVRIRCCAWRAYEAAAEAFLRAAKEVEQVLVRNKSESSDTPGEKADSIKPFIGGLDKDGLAPMLHDQSKINHRGKALELVLRAISSYEYEFEKNTGKEAGKETEENENEKTAWSGSGARLYYLAGGLLLGRGRFEDAIVYLEKSAQLSSGWKALEKAIHRMLVECYEKQMPRSSEVKTRTQTFIDSYLNTEMAPKNVQLALDRFTSANESAKIKYEFSCLDTADPNLPFSLVVTFPGRSHGTTGDSASALVWIKSNLNVSVQVYSLVLVTNAGEMNLPLTDLMTATNVVIGSASRIFVRPMSCIQFSTTLDVPKDLESITSDVVEKPTTGGKAATKGARPRTSGISSAAGARFIQENAAVKKKSSQWSMKLLGGRPLTCNGFRLSFTPEDVDSLSETSNEGSCAIELGISKTKRKPPINIKKPPSELENYLAEAWSHPANLLLNCGPRCLRVSGAMSQMTVTNVTHPVINGTGVEGTVNRIFFKLQAGPDELCKSITFDLKCSSTFTKADGTVLHLEETADASENEVKVGEKTDEKRQTADIKQAEFRAPILVQTEEKHLEPHQTEYGYEIPAGWAVAGSGQENHTTLEPPLKSGEVAHIFFDVFRPSQAVGPFIQDIVGVESKDTKSTCRTEFELKISYMQQRRCSETSGPKEVEVDVVPDQVTKVVTGSLTWISPIAASFSVALKNSFPSGSRHPSNLIDDTTGGETTDVDIPVIDGERLNLRCNLRGHDSQSDRFAFEIRSIKFDSLAGAGSPCDLKLLSGGKKSSDGMTLYEATAKDPSRWLSKGSSFSCAWCVEAIMKTTGTSSLPLGGISIDWSPYAIELPADVKTTTMMGGFGAHGPLPLKSMEKLKFLGPTGYFQNAPFQVDFKCEPTVPTISSPFEVCYKFQNKTHLHQKLDVVLNEKTESKSGEILVCGLMTGELKIGPLETRTYKYTAVATRAGMATLPVLKVSSARYGSWVVNESWKNSRPLYVMP